MLQKSLLSWKYLHRNYISTKDLTATQIDAIVKQLKDTSITVKPADEIKVVIMSFQNCPPGISPIEIVGAKPQTSNEVSTFIAVAVDAATESCTDFGWEKVVLPPLQLMVYLQRVLMSWPLFVNF